MLAVSATLTAYLNLKYESCKHGWPSEFSITRVWTVTHLASPAPVGI